MKLAPEALLRSVDVASLGFASTADLEPLSEPLAQERAREAIEFGVGMRAAGYNIYALGSSQTDKRALVLERLHTLAAQRDSPDDWCYLQNFDDTARPICVQLAAGNGRLFKRRMQEFITNVRTMVPSAFAADEYRRESQSLSSELQERQTADAADLENRAKDLGLSMLPTPNGFMFAPMREGKVIEPDAFMALDADERRRVQEAVTTMTELLQERMRDYPQYQQRVIEQQRELAKRTADQVITHLLARLRTYYQSHDKIAAYLQAVHDELCENVDKIMQPERSDHQSMFMPAPDPEAYFDRFAINLIVDSSESTGATVLYESNPSLDNLVGKLEHRMEYGTPVTDFQLIRPGALHRANGGYLLLDAERLLQKPFAWEALKRAMGDGCVRIESVSQLLNLTYSISLEPEAIPLDVKIVLLGSRRLYHLLRQYDPDFDEQFKVVADFDDDVDWSDDNVKAYSRLLAKVVADIDIKHLDAAAVGRVLEHSSRSVEDRQRLSTHICDLRDLLRESDHLANESGADLICRQHVDEAIAKRIYRLDRFRELVRENVARGVVLVESQGLRVGQVNGLSIVQIGQTRFGQPMRITATARLGRGELIDIERESRLGGKIHAKAVMIVSSFLGSRYAKNRPLALHASLVFEQSYGGVEGDSASIAEVCALISAIIDRPIKQCWAVTGSMDQHGIAQAIGGVNEKIEGFFDICQAQELTGDQGVIIPATNQDHLMLRQDVVDAVAAGNFHVHTMANVDDAMKLLFAAEGVDTVAVEEIDLAVQERIEHLYRIWRRSGREQGLTDDESDARGSVDGE